MLRRILFFLSLFISLHSFSQNFNSIWNTINTSGGSSADNQITIPTNPAFTNYNYTVDWGDGSQDTNVTGDITHTYSTQGTYTISISGIFPAIYFNNTGDRQKIIEILAWGTIQWQTMENAFYGCTNLNFDAIDSPDLSQVTTLSNMFRSASSFNGIINNWDISTVTNISGLFAAANIFNRPLDNWNTGNVINMSETFSSANSFNEPLDNWNTASVTDMSSMFSAANRFNQNINNWNVSNVSNMEGMFRYTGSFVLPLNNWNVSNVTNMSRMFEGSRFNLPLNNWNVSNVTNMSGMFSQYSSFNQNINNWDVSSVINMSDMFMRATQYDQPMDNWDVSSVTDMSSMFDGFIAKMIFNQPLNSWDVSSVTNMRQMFRDCRDFDQPLDNWNVANVTDMSRMFEDTQNFNQDLSGWDVSNVTNMSSMFQETDLFNQNLNMWDVSSVTSMLGMFFGSQVFNLPLNNWDVSAVEDFRSTFGYSNFNQDITNWDTGSAITMQGMFSNAAAFDQNLASWNITGVNNMVDMLSNSGLSQENYDNILIGWANQAVTDNVNLGATNLTYCDGLNARQELIDDHNWSFTGDSVNCSFVLCTEITSPRDTDTQVPANSDIRWAPAPNADGYRVSIRRENGGTTEIIYDNQDFGNVVGIDFTNEFTPGDTVYVTVVPYNDEGPAVGCPEISFTVVESWINSPDTFKLTYDTALINGTQTTPANQLKIETSSGLTYDYSIDWGDGQYDNNVSNDITHTYLTPGIYTVSIIGDYPAPRHEESNSDSYKLISIDQWGTQVWESMSGAFAGCQNMEYNATDIPNLTNVEDMSRMFIVCFNFNGNINDWDVSNVTNMFAMFGVTPIYNQPLNNWDVSNVTNMSLMFFRTDVFNQDITNWNTSNVTDMQRMFEDADAFNQPINNWDVSNVTNMRQMFQRAQVFDQALNNWNVSNVTDMSRMFDSTNAFNQNIDSWDVSSVTNMISMFRFAQAFNQPLNSWDVSSVTNMSFMFNNAIAFNQPLNNWDVSSVINTASMFNSASVFNQDINSWNVTNVTSMQSMFSSALAYNQPMNSWDVNSVVDMSSMFFNAEAFNQPLDNWNVSAVANMTSMFEDTILFNQPINTWDVSSVTLMESMFEAAEVFNQLINDWDVASVTNFEAMFKDAIAFDQPLSAWDTGEALTMEEMFYGASVFNQNIDAWDVSFVTTMASMFRDAVAYNQDMNSWNVASVTTMQSMFQNATEFNGIIGSWNVRAVTTMQDMFNNAPAFNQDISNWRVFGVQNMNNMFQNALSYNQNMDGWILGSTTMRNFLRDATSFNQSLEEWDVSSITDMQNMLDNTAIERTNYDNTLIAWSELTLTPGITFGALTLPYCDALEERQSMIDTYGWNIVGDIRDCPIPECTVLTSPLNGDIDVPVNTNITWEPALYARGYRLTVGTSPGGNDVVDDETINNETFYEFATDFNTGDIIYVTIIPFNDEGNAVGPCTEESFTISNDPATIPECTELNEPLNNAADVEVTSDLSWNPISNADGYRITVGTTFGGNELVDNEDVGNTTTYEFTADLPEDSDIFVTIIPYNDRGALTSCTEERFDTELIPIAPICTSLTSPENNDTDVAIDTNLSWEAIANATGYLISIGTTSGGIEVANSIDVGNVTTYDIPDDLSENRSYYVTIIPYNDVGDATGCLEENFRTIDNSIDPPTCTTLISPSNGEIDIAIDLSEISWNPVTNATQYRITIDGSTSNANDVTDLIVTGTSHSFVNDFDNGETVNVAIVPLNGSVEPVATCTTETFTIVAAAPTSPSCTTLVSPANGATDVAIATDITWNTVTGAEGYRLTIGTIAGGNDILDNEDVGNILTYNPPTEFLDNTEVFVTIVPYIGTDNATGCIEESFTTEIAQPGCANLITPVFDATDVPVNTNLIWNMATNAVRYSIAIGTATGLDDILATTDVGNNTTFDPPTDLPANTRVFVTINSFNSAGDSIVCGDDQFTTGDRNAVLPDCTVLSSPLDGDIDVSANTNISWNAVANADGYRLTVGSSPGDNDIINNFDAGNTLTFDFSGPFADGITVYITITSYNMDGNALNCAEESFTIASPMPDPLSCATLTTPLNDATNVAIGTNIAWNEVLNADGYRLSVGTTAGGNNILNNEDVGILTTYQLPNSLPFEQQIFVTITPYNADGDAENCEEQSFITVVEPEQEIETLNGFSPDRDGINEFWRIEGIENHPNNIVVIYNRWGDMVFKIEGYDNNSNVFGGEANQLTGFGASQLPEGTYFFNIILSEPNNFKQTKGYLVLKR
ncbi:BspA family leucine-rich repeat surface protein [uncultured Croceitalea sp.]|uniref:BspA family leucine-rich repeat surface protein n=1 Tax=uncultured Croceitalea sp. TaxID=1798908 RepID=UPI00374F2490